MFYLSNLRFRSLIVVQQFQSLSCLQNTAQLIRVTELFFEMKICGE